MVSDSLVWKDPLGKIPKKTFFAIHEYISGDACISHLGLQWVLSKLIHILLSSV